MVNKNHTTKTELNELMSQHEKLEKMIAETKQNAASEEAKKLIKYVEEFMETFTDIGLLGKLHVDIAQCLRNLAEYDSDFHRKLARETVFGHQVTKDYTRFYLQNIAATVGLVNGGLYSVLQRLVKLGNEAGNPISPPK